MLNKSLNKIYHHCLCDLGSKNISKVKIGTWCSVICSCLLIKNFITLETFELLVVVSTGILGTGIRDLRKK
jgi:hypothetical protein